jgi:hypothetical protein
MFSFPAGSLWGSGVEFSKLQIISDLPKKNDTF